MTRSHRMIENRRFNLSKAKSKAEVLFTNKQKKIMKKLILFTLLLIIVQSEIFSQGEYYNWYFGKNAGISFSPDGKDPYAITNSAMDTREGCAVISDSLGNLLFYTNGVKIWNRQHDIMLNCTELQGGWHAGSRMGGTNWDV